MAKKGKTCIWGITRDMVVEELDDGMSKVRYKGDHELGYVVGAFMNQKIVVTPRHVYVYPVWFSRAMCLPHDRTVPYADSRGLVTALKGLYSTPVVVDYKEIRVLSKG